MAREKTIERGEGRGREGGGRKRKGTEKCNERGNHKHCYKSAAVERNPWYASHRSIAATLRQLTWLRRIVNYANISAKS